VAQGSAELTIELGMHARMRVPASQVALAAQLLKALNGGASC